tara:strand:- start:5019 stop:5462 length:444 start_codon:yes stop_codon:yes gene_type:complete
MSLIEGKLQSRLAFQQEFFGLTEQEKIDRGLPITNRAWAKKYGVHFITITEWIKNGKRQGLVVPEAPKFIALSPEEREALRAKGEREALVKQLKGEIENGTASSADKRLYAELRDWIKPKAINVLISNDERVRQIIEARKELSGAKK